jgi:hypothetical protein
MQQSRLRLHDPANQRNSSRDLSTPQRAGHFLGRVRSRERTQPTISAVNSSDWLNLGLVAAAFVGGIGGSVLLLLQNRRKGRREELVEVLRATERLKACFLGNFKAASASRELQDFRGAVAVIRSRKAFGQVAFYCDTLEVFILSVSNKKPAQRRLSHGQVTQTGVIVKEIQAAVAKVS